MKVAVIGLNWGHVHINAYRQSGHEVVAVVDTDMEHCAAVGRQYAIPHCFGTVEELAGVSPELVSVAVPADHHLEVLEKLSNMECAVICEKPVLGFKATTDMYTGLSPDVFFNYAYPFLQDMDIFYQKLAAIRDLRKIDITCLYNLQLSREFSPEELFYETVSHPVALLVHAFPDIAGAVRTGESTIKATTGTGIEINIKCRKEIGIDGIRHLVKAAGTDRLSLYGEYITGSNWHYSPVEFNGAKVSGDYYPAEDPWFTANKKSLVNILSYLMKKQSLEDTLKKGAFSLKKAMIVENILNCLKKQ